MKRITISILLALVISSCNSQISNCPDNRLVFTMDKSSREYRLFDLEKSENYTGGIVMSKENLNFIESYKNGMKDGTQYQIKNRTDTISIDIFEKGKLKYSVHYKKKENRILDSTYVKEKTILISDKIFIERLTNNLNSNNVKQFRFLFEDFESETFYSKQLAELIDIFGETKSVDLISSKKIYNSYNNSNYFTLNYKFQYNKNYVIVDFIFIFNSEKKPKAEAFSIIRIGSEKGNFDLKKSLKEKLLISNRIDLIKEIFDDDYDKWLSTNYSFDEEFYITFNFGEKFENPTEIIKINVFLKGLLLEKSDSLNFSVSKDSNLIKKYGCRW